MQSDKEIKKKIARVLGSRPTYIEIVGKTETLDECRLEVIFKGFGYVVQMQNDEVKNMARKVG